MRPGRGRLGLSRVRWIRRVLVLHSISLSKQNGRISSRLAVNSGQSVAFADYACHYLQSSVRDSSRPPPDI